MLHLLGRKKLTTKLKKEAKMKRQVTKQELIELRLLASWQKQNAIFNKGK